MGSCVAAVSQETSPVMMRTTESGWCCCPLQTLVLVLAIFLTSTYLILIGSAVVCWVLHSSQDNSLRATVVEVDSLTEVNNELVDVLEEETDIVVIILVTTIIGSVVGLVTTLLLSLGVSRARSPLLLPWLVWHMLQILGSVGSGLYLVIHFLLLLEERSVTNAILSLIPILAGIFLIFPWVLVDQLYVKYKQTKIIIEMDNPIKRSMSSLSIISRQPTDTMRSNRSNRSKVSGKSVRSVKKRNDQRRQTEREFQLCRKSRSLEQILDNSSYSGSSSGAASSLDQLAAAGLTTLPRLRRCHNNPGMWRAAFTNNNYNSDTIRSYKSVQSVKSVQISNRVTEFHYSDSEAPPDKTLNYDSTEDIRPVEAEDINDTLQLPTPVYPTINKNKTWNRLGEKKNTFTKDQIIDLYCASNTDR